jgi:dTDP-4-dehydrorhamnose reductase
MTNVDACEQSRKSVGNINVNAVEYIATSCESD